MHNLDRVTLAEAHHWLHAALGVCGLLMTEDEVIDRQPEVYLQSVAEAQARWPELQEQVPVALETLAAYLRRLPREN